ncbi:MAG TPA: MaoC family dehydratase [Albidovulum sp.]|uniref:MaoC family dehydratase n=1 Tax=Albidovulum sp. TaxID=1872424 RepID=UPI002BC67A8A|nr:MaoC family dehydratase [Albidovulum sp.]
MCAEAVTGTLYLDDVKVGEVFRSREQSLDTEDVIAFAGRFDPQRFHLDDAAAKDTIFKGLAASGWHTAAITMRLLVESMPLADGLIGAGVEITWPRPTRPGDTLRAETTILDIRPSRSKPDQAMATLETLTYNQNGEIVQRMQSKNVLYRRRG